MAGARTLYRPRGSGGDSLLTGHIGAFLEVCARAEHIVELAGQDESLRAVRLLLLRNGADVRVELGEERGGKCIAIRRAVKGEDDDGADVHGRDDSAIDEVGS